jgi:hypothetical protein
MANTSSPALPPLQKASEGRYGAFGRPDGLAIRGMSDQTTIGKAL